MWLRGFASPTLGVLQTLVGFPLSKVYSRILHDYLLGSDSFKCIMSFLL
jgi:hypothetical protein